MARITHGTPKADKNLKGTRIGWTGAVIRDGSGYYGEGETDIPAPEAGAFPPKLADQSRLRASPSEALKAELAAAQGVTKTVTETVTYCDGAEVVAPSVPKKKPNKLVEYMTRIKADPEAFSQYMEKQKAGYRAWLAKRKAKRGG